MLLFISSKHPSQSNFHQVPKRDYSINYYIKKNEYVSCKWRKYSAIVVLESQP